ncbi:MAG TPA: hypothetical protein VEC06_17220 [Paucimonas sp.]|nr:hypothetical protein [Paucimonas sp.]
MKIIKQTRDRLVIEDFAWRFGLLFFAGGVIYGCLLYRDGDPLWQSMLAVGGFGLVGWMRAYRLLVIFDRGEGFVRMEERRVGWRRCRSVPLAEIAAVDLVERRAVTDPTTWRVELKMRRGPNAPLLWEFTSRDEQYRPIAAAIGKFLDVPVVEREGRD